MQGMGADILLEVLVAVGMTTTARAAPYLWDRVKHISPFVSGLVPEQRPDPTSPMELEELLDRLARVEKRPVRKKAMSVTVSGTLFPALLLTSGWWERQKEAEREPIKWKNHLQEWFFTGFEQWGPSWNVNPEIVDETNPHLLAQLASGDEVNSISVVILGDEALKVRDWLQEREVIPVRVKGTLYHRAQLSEQLATLFQESGSKFNYCIVVDPSQGSQGIEEMGDRPETYSGYLWQCVAPAAKVADNPYRVRLEDVYFVWEHAEISQPSVLEFFRGSLQRKIEQVESKIGGKVAVLQMSSKLSQFDQPPLMPTDIFYKVILSNVSQRE